MGSLFNVYPNPSNDLLYVHSLLSGIYSIKIYDLVGSLVFQKEAFGNTALETIHKIDISGQASGMYLLEIETPEGNMSQKIMIQ